MTQPDPQPARPVQPATPPPGFGKRNVAIAVLMVTLMVLLALGQWVTIQAGQDVARALAGSTPTGTTPVDIKFRGMSFSGEHVLIARYDIEGAVNVSTAKWHARPWGHVQLAP